MIEFGVAIIISVIVFRILKINFKLGAGLFFLDVIVAWWLPGGIQITSIAGINIFLADIIFFCSFVLFLQSIRDIRDTFPALLNLTLCIFLIFAISLGRGIFAFGFQPAINESRLLIYPIGALMWGLYASRKICPRLQDLRIIAIFIALCMLSVEIINIGLHGFGSASDIQLADGSILNLRPLVHIQALSLLAAFSILFISALSSNKKRTVDVILSTVAITGIVFSQQRSVLLAALVTVLALIFQRRTAIIGSVTVIIGLLFVLVIPWTSLSFIPIELRNSLADSSSNLTTYIAREGSWVQYINSFITWDPLEQLLGKPFGSGWGRYDGFNNLWVEFNPHNWYIVLILRTGILGLALFVILYLQKLIVSIKLGPKGFGLVLIQIQHLVFQNFYPMPWQIVQVVAVQNFEPEEIIPKKKNKISRRTELGGIQN